MMPRMIDAPVKSAATKKAPKRGAKNVMANIKNLLDARRAMANARPPMRPAGPPMPGQTIAGGGAGPTPASIMPGAGAMVQ